MSDIFNINLGQSPTQKYTDGYEKIRTKKLEQENEALRKQNAKYREALEYVEFLSQNANSDDVYKECIKALEE